MLHQRKWFVELPGGPCLYPRRLMENHCAIIDCIKQLSKGFRVAGKTYSIPIQSVNRLV